MAFQFISPCDDSNDDEVRNFLIKTSKKVPKFEEFLGYHQAVYETKLPINIKTGKYLDICGTGGDGKNTFNISTLAAFIIAGAGIKVAKWGSYSASSVCGSSNLLESLGIELCNEEEKINNELEERGITFLHAPLFYPALKRIAPIRKELGIRTVFNLLGPLLNPTTPSFRLLGTNNHATLKLYSKFLDHKSGIEDRTEDSFSIVSSIDGYDEISLTSDFYLASNYFNKKLKIDKVNIQELVGIPLSPDLIKGGETIEENKEIFLKIINGEGTEEQNQVVIINAAFGIVLSDPEMSFTESIELARKSLYSGKAWSAELPVLSNVEGQLGCSNHHKTQTKS